MPGCTARSPGYQDPVKDNAGLWRKASKPRGTSDLRVEFPDLTRATLYIPNPLTKEMKRIMQTTLGWRLLQIDLPQQRINNLEEHMSGCTAGSLTMSTSLSAVEKIATDKAQLNDAPSSDSHECWLQLFITHE
jgi:hypothetical protein